MDGWTDDSGDLNECKCDAAFIGPSNSFSSEVEEY